MSQRLMLRFYFTELKNTIETQVNELRSQIESRCSIQ